MDDDVEVIIPDSLDEPQNLFTNFSQVQIKVHVDDVENILKVCEDIPENADEVLEISDELAPNQDSYFETTVATKAYLASQIDNEINIDQEEMEHDGVLEEEDTDRHENVDLIVPDIEESKQIFEIHDLTTESDLVDDLDHIERIQDKNLHNYEAVIEYHGTYNNISITEETESFTETEFETPEMQQHSDEIETEDNCHYNSRIILGTKPCQTAAEGYFSREADIHGDVANEHTDLSGYSNEIDVIQKENCYAFVVVENWDVKLNNSKCFCRECGTLFSTPNALMAHNTSEHSFLVPINKNIAIKSTSKSNSKKSVGTLNIKNCKNSARKSTGSNSTTAKVCNHCNKIFPDHDTLVKHLYEFVTNIFKCQICDSVFITEKDLITHNIKHCKVEKERSETKKKKANDNEKEKIGLKNKLLYEEDVRKELPLKKIQLLPISVLFQCPTCKLNFLSCTAGLLHAKFCNTNRLCKPKICSICKGKFSKTNYKLHMKQHKFCKTFKIYNITPKLPDKMLWQCKKCQLHFSDFGLISHAHFKSCGKVRFQRCPNCNILFPESKLVNHMLLHTKSKMKPKDFILVQSIIQFNSKAKPNAQQTSATTSRLSNVRVEKETSNNKENINTLKIKKASLIRSQLRNIKLKNKLMFKRNNKIPLYYCAHCNCYYHKHFPKHNLNKKCIDNRNLATGMKPVCQECGLQFTKKAMKAHLDLHKRRAITLHDFAFCQMSTLKTINPKMPDYFQCSDCKIHFFDLGTRASHICGKDYKTCNICLGKFHSSVLPSHRQFHLIRQGGKPPQPIIPDLIKKYKSLNMIWNIVYCCETCETVTHHYDKAIEHSQEHLNDQVVGKNIKCYICNLKIDETCWSKHSELHSRMKINSNDFKILNYQPGKLLSEEWFKFFECLSGEQIQQITENSLYGEERKFKITLFKEGRPEFTLYCCSECSVCMRSNKIDKHIQSDCNTSDSINCKECHILFCDIVTLKSHQILHMKGIKSDEFRVVQFTKYIKNKTIGKSINNEVDSIKSKVTNKDIIKVSKTKSINKIKSDSKSIHKLRQDSSGKFVFYKCTNCKYCSIYKTGICNHRCMGLRRRYRCEICKEAFHHSAKPLHDKRHQKYPTLKSDNLKLIYYNPKKHKVNWDPDTEEEEPVQKKLKQDLSTNGKKSNSDLSNNSSDKNNHDPLLPPSTPSICNLYKCECGLHYTSLQAVARHARRCRHSDVSKDTCNKCGLLFPTDILITHLVKHLNKNTQFTVELYQKDNTPSTSGKSSSTIRKPNDDSLIKLYKCSECEVHFVSRGSCYKHINKNHKRIEDVQCINCKLCGLQFRVYGLASHIETHHSSHFDMSKVSIEVYAPRRGKIDTYVLADKVQWLQVTSSIQD